MEVMIIWEVGERENKVNKYKSEVWKKPVKHIRGVTTKYQLKFNDDKLHLTRLKVKQLWTPQIEFTQKSKLCYWFSSKMHKKNHYAYPVAKRS